MTRSLIGQMHQPDPRPLGVKLLAKLILAFQSFDGAPTRAGEDQIVRPLQNRVERLRSGCPKAEQFNCDADQILIERLSEGRVNRQVVRVPGITQQPSINLYGWECRRNGRTR